MWSNQPAVKAKKVFVMLKDKRTPQAKNNIINIKPSVLINNSLHSDTVPPLQKLMHFIGGPSTKGDFFHAKRHSFVKIE